MRLTLTYMLVTVGALLALLIVVLIGFGFLTSFRPRPSEFVDDISYVLGRPARDYLLEDNREGLQQWMAQRYTSELASDPPLNWSDSPIAYFAEASDFYVLNATGEVVAQVPTQTQIGRKFIPPPIIHQRWFEQQRSTRQDAERTAAPSADAGGGWAAADAEFQHRLPALGRI